MNKEAINNYYFLYIHNFFTSFSSLPFYLFVFFSIPEQIQDHFKVKIKKYDCMITYPLCVIFHQLSETK